MTNNLFNVIFLMLHVSAVGDIIQTDLIIRVTIFEYHLVKVILDLKNN